MSRYRMAFDRAFDSFCNGTTFNSYAFIGAFSNLTDRTLWACFRSESRICANGQDLSELFSPHSETDVFHFFEGYENNPFEKRPWDTASWWRANGFMVGMGLFLGLFVLGAIAIVVVVPCMVGFQKREMGEERIERWKRAGWGVGSAGIPGIGIGIGTKNGNGTRTDGRAGLVANAAPFHGESLNVNGEDGFELQTRSSSYGSGSYSTPAAPAAAHAPEIRNADAWSLTVADNPFADTAAIK